MINGEPRGESGLVKRLKGLKRTAFSLGVSSAIGLGGLLYGGNVMADSTFDLFGPIKEILGSIGKGSLEKQWAEEERIKNNERAMPQRSTYEGNVWIDYNEDGITDYNEVINKSRFFSDEGATFILELEPYTANKTLAFELYDSNEKKATSLRSVIPNEAKSGKKVWGFSFNNFENYLLGLRSGENNFTARYVLSDGTRSNVIKSFPITITKLGGEDDVAKTQQLQN